MKVRKLNRFISYTLRQRRGRQKKRGREKCTKKATNIVENSHTCSMYIHKKSTLLTYTRHSSTKSTISTGVSFLLLLLIFESFTLDIFKFWIPASSCILCELQSDADNFPRHFRWCCEMKKQRHRPGEKGKTECECVNYSCSSEEYWILVLTRHHVLA